MMSDASVQVIDGRVVVRVGGSELLSPIVAQAAGYRDTTAGFAAAGNASATLAGERADAASLAATAAASFVDGILYPSAATGLAPTIEGKFFTVVGDGTNTYAILYRKVNGAAVEQARYASKAAYEGPAGAGLIGFAQDGASVTRTVAAALKENPSIRSFGAVPDYNPDNGSGTDSLAAINAGIAYLASQGGGRIFVPPVGAYKISGPIIPGNKVTLYGCSSIIGGPGSIHATGSKLFNFTATTVFSLDNVSFVGKLGVTDIAGPGGGLWAYSHLTENYFANFREWDQVLLGIRASKNTFQNLCKVHQGGSDNEFFENLIQYDTTTHQLGANDVFWQWEAMSASSFHHNYLTCLGPADIDPTVFDLNLSDRVRVKDNQFDGGRYHTLRISSATHSCEFATNRTSSDASASDTLSAEYVPIVIRENLIDVQIDRTWCQGLKPGAPFVSSIGGMKRVSITDTKFADSFADDSLHDIAPTSDRGRVIISGPAHPRAISLPDGSTFRSWHFNRLLSNAGQTVGELINGFDTSALIAGDIINCRVADDTKRWIIASPVGNIYDSQLNVGKRSFRIICIVDGEPILDY